MIKILKHSLLVVVTLASFQSMNAQLFKKKKKESCPTYSEDLSGAITTHPEFSIDSLTPEVVEDGDGNESLVLKNDNLIADSLLKVQQEYYGNKTSMPGYRIQIWSGQNHISMQNNIAVFRNEFGDMGLAVHDNYDNAYFRVKVGDFYQKEHLQAYRALVRIREKFPNSLLVPADVRL